MSEKQNTAQELGEEELDRIAGGAASRDPLHDLRYFISREVFINMFGDTSCLTLRSSPGGRAISGISWENGESILIHSQYKEDGWYLAYKNGVYGYVDPNYVW